MMHGGRTEGRLHDGVGIMAGEPAMAANGRKGRNGISHEVMIGFSYTMDQTNAWFEIQ